jgi:uncharacterized membrane protein
MKKHAQILVAAALAIGGTVGWQQDTDAQAPARARYRIIDLGTLGGEFSRALSVNNRGEVSGESLLADNGDVAAFYWGGGGMRQLTPYDPLAVGSSAGKAINDSGVVVGYYDPSSFPNTPPVRMFRYDSATDTLEFLAEGSANDINNAGQILARGPGAHDYIIGGVDLDAAFGGAGVNASRLNAAGEVAVGGALAGQGSFIYRQGQFVPVPEIGAAALNDFGQVAGTYQVDLGINGIRTRAALVEPDGVVRRFAPLNTLGLARASAINNHGQIVGHEVTFVSGHRVTTAFIIENGVTRRLQDLLPSGSGWTLSGDFGEANDINDRGEIVGTGLINGEWHAFLMTPELCTAADDVDESGDPDNDADGLCDSWEVNGIDVDRDGTIDLNLRDDVGAGVNLNHKDLLIEFDWMDCQVGPTSDCGAPHDHDPGDLTDVYLRFTDAFVFNPDGRLGVDFWLFESEPVPHIDPRSSRKTDLRNWTTSTTSSWATARPRATAS